MQKQIELIDSWIAKAYNEKLCQLPWTIQSGFREMLLAKLACKKALEGKNIVVLSPSLVNARDIVKEIKRVPVAANWICETQPDRVRFITEGTIISKSIHNTMALLGLNCDCLYLDIVAANAKELDQWIRTAHYMYPREQLIFCSNTPVDIKDLEGCVQRSRDVQTIIQNSR